VTSKILNKQRRDREREVNEERPCRATGIIPVAWQKKRRALSEAAARAIGPVHPGVCGPPRKRGARWHGYGMPAEAISTPATLYLYPQRVRIVAGSYGAEHPRMFAAEESSWLAEHRAQMLSSVSGKRSKRYLKPQQLLELPQRSLSDRDRASAAAGMAPRC
jgi:hypothetical protein